MVDVYEIMIGERHFKVVVKNALVRFSWPENVSESEVSRVFGLLKNSSYFKELRRQSRRAMKFVLGTKVDFGGSIRNGGQILLVEWIDEHLNEDAAWLLHPDWEYSIRTSTDWMPLSVVLKAAQHSGTATKESVNICRTDYI
jgi:hypothetical protein